MRGPLIRTFHHRDFEPAALAAAKGGHRVSVCLPARDEEATVGAVVAAVRHDLVDACGLVDEIVVIDDHSTDATARAAASAGARVVHAGDVLADIAPGPGKGAALWRSLVAASGDLVVWCDADVVDFGSHYVTGLLGPLLARPEVVLVKGFYDRPVDRADGGGRVTELVARPLISMLFPHLTAVVQPLGGEYASRRGVLERLPFEPGYGVELGLLVDVAALAGVEAIAQVDLGVRRHRNRSLHELGPQALAVLAAALRRAGVDAAATPTALVRPTGEAVLVDPTPLPPLLEVPAYRRSA